METTETTSKREKRWARKKRKIQAFLEVAKLNDNDQDQNTSLASTPHAPGLVSFVPKGAEDLAVFRAQLKKRQKAAMERPKLFMIQDKIKVAASDSLQQTPLSADVDSDSKTTPTNVPLCGKDLQNLILFAIMNRATSYIPRWCKLLRPAKIEKVVVLELAGISKQMFLDHRESLSRLQAYSITECVEVVSPLQQGSSFLREVFSIPETWPKLDDDPKAPWNKSLETAKYIQEVLCDAGTEAPCSRVDLLLTRDQMRKETYRLPEHKLKQFVTSKHKYEPVTADSPIYAIDCEMVMSVNQEQELAWIAVVNEKLETIYETLVQPTSAVRNYLTRYSGVTKAMLADVTTGLKDVQEALRCLLPPDAILCGHSFCSDLKAMKMYHPYVIDSSVIYNVSGQRFMKSSLKNLTLALLGKTIQKDGESHSPSEDAKCSMELIQLKLRKGLLFGDIILKRNPKQKDTGSDSESSTDSPRPKKRRRLNGNPGSEKIPYTVGCNHGNNSEDGDVACFFDMMQFAHRPEEVCSVSLIGPPFVLSPWQQDRHKDNLVFTEAEDRGSCVQATKEALQGGSFCVWTHFPWEGGEDKSSQDIQKYMQKLDKSLKKVVKKCQNNTLLIVLFNGLPTKKTSSNAVCMLKIV